MKCFGCKIAVYCSKECQRKDWSNHKIICNPQKTKAAQKAKTARKAEEAYQNVFCTDPILLDQVRKGKMTLDNARALFQQRLMEESIEMYKNPDSPEALEFKSKVIKRNKEALKKAKEYDKYAKLAGLPKLDLEEKRKKGLKSAGRLADVIGPDRIVKFWEVLGEKR